MWSERGGSERLGHTAKRLARHASPLTTMAYTHVSDEEMYGEIWKVAK